MQEFTAVLILTSTVFALAGGAMRCFPPKRINSIYGYRTTRSMRSQEAWDFAQRMSANWMLGLASIYIVAAIILWSIGDLPAWVTIFFTISLVITLVVMIWRVERALKRKFS
jgi:uncharacterized membrane protein